MSDNETRITRPGQRDQAATESVRLLPTLTDETMNQPMPNHPQSCGWLTTARPCPSPNHNQRPPGMPVDLLVIHNISLPPGDFGGPGIEQLFLNQLDPAQHPFFATIANLRVSAHLLIRRDGELIQFVDLRARLGARLTLDHPLVRDMVSRLTVSGIMARETPPRAHLLVGL